MLTRSAATASPGSVNATTLVDSAGTRLLTDPVLRSRIVHIRRIAPPAAAISGIVLLLSHAHLDHLDIRTLRALPAGVPVIAPAGAARVLRRWTKREIIEVTAGDRVEVGALGVEVVPAAHDGRRVPVGRATPAVGYVVAADSARIGFFGRHGRLRRMRELSIHVALLPIWGWGSRVGPGHLDPVLTIGGARMGRPAEPMCHAKPAAQRRHRAPFSLPVVDLLQGSEQGAATLGMKITPG